jgi:DNA-binding MarR family transcriptional regulator
MSAMSTERDQIEAVQRLFDVLVRFSRSLKARGADWGNVVHDLTRGDIVTLGVLDARGSSRPGQVATALAVDPSVVSRQLASLDRLGLIRREPDPVDGRAELVGLTAEGRRRLAAARAAMCAVLAERLEKWPVEDIAQAAALVEDLDERLHQPIRPLAPITTTQLSKEVHV